MQFRINIFIIAATLNINILLLYIIGNGAALKTSAYNNKWETISGKKKKMMMVEGSEISIESISNSSHITSNLTTRSLIPTSLHANNGRKLNSKYSAKYSDIFAMRGWRHITGSADGKKIIAIVDWYGTMFRSTDGGISWNTLDSRYWGITGIVSSSDFKTIVVLLYDGVHVSRDQGNTWNKVLDGNKNNNNLRAISASADCSKLVIYRENGNLWRSIDSGNTWREITPTGSSKVWESVTSSSDGVKVAAVTENGKIWRSIDSGATWAEDSSIGKTLPWTSITSSSDGEVLWACTDSETYKSVNAGATWAKVSSVGGGTNIKVSGNGGTILISGGQNMIKSVNSGSTWNEVTNVGIKTGWARTYWQHLEI